MWDGGDDNIKARTKQLGELLKITISEKPEAAPKESKSPKADA